MIVGEWRWKGFLFCYSSWCSFLWILKEAADFERLQSGHLTKLLEDDFWADVSTLHVQKIISAVSELLERLKSYGEDGTASKHMVINGSLQASCCPEWAGQRENGFHLTPRGWSQSRPPWQNHWGFDLFICVNVIDKLEKLRAC